MSKVLDKPGENCALRGVFLVPGLPHILQHKDKNESLSKLHDAMKAVGHRAIELETKRIIYISTTWISVLGQMFQARKDLRGMHVDENWYEYGDLDYSFKVDVSFAKKLSERIKDSGQKVMLVDFDRFPVDTGTIVADKLINNGMFETGMVANNVYTDFEGAKGIAAHIRETIEEDGVPTVVVGVSSMSQRFFTTDVDMREDHFGNAEDDKWNKRILSLLEDGKHDEVEKLIPEFAKIRKRIWDLKSLGF